MFKKNFLKRIARNESVPFSLLEKGIKQGKIVIPLNKKSVISIPPAIGDNLKIKINTNIGISTKKSDINNEIKKMACAIKYGTDTIMDLSVGKKLIDARKKILKNCTVPLGTVPMYEIAHQVKQRKGSYEKITFDDIWDVLKLQAEQGVDFFTIHAGILKKAVDSLRIKKRLGGIVSRGGALLAHWIYTNKKENPFYENFDKIIELLKKYNITLSLGDALRPGAIADSTDYLQIFELKVLGELVKKCRKAKVQVMVEGPGHIRLDEIGMNMLLEKKICKGAPFYVLGPLPIDIAAGYDHISSAIGGTIAAFYGANFLCVVTPAEHLRHPNINDIKEGVIASKIAAHSVDVLRFNDEWKKDYRISYYRAKRMWSKMFPLTIDEDKARKYRKMPKSPQDTCSMCGDFCSLKISDSVLNATK